ncbi:ABC transporter ATP-binding protein [Beijerinckia sp. L45]|uniref:ABC transporter ATP-binding protein n=1 Tax=Beijerinckia sp. L45 TaxID=1641855 RepID=UPI001FF00374|nr:ABC transporter ATP-binding protein [Beijerinckia sp. L45]
MVMTEGRAGIEADQKYEPDIKIRITGLTKSFRVGAQDVVALQDLSLNIKAGEFIVIVGPSGCGKTTLLRIVAGLDRQSHGHVVRQHADPKKPLSTMIFQEHAVFPWFSVEKNIEYGLRMRGVPKRERRATVEQFLGKMGLRDYAKAYPHQLSGGMKQRVSIARAFANDPEILCMDEPFAALDEQNKAIMLEELTRIWSETLKTALFITHSLDEALILADRIVVMTSRPGRIAAIFDNPLPRPRKSYEIRRDPAYGKLSAEIWDILRVEVLKSRGELPA